MIIAITIVGVILCAAAAYNYLTADNDHWHGYAYLGVLLLTLAADKSIHC
jgi:TRAP-type uncharacterized transport system fused permease subunit